VSRYGLHTRAVTVYRNTLSDGFSHLVASMTARVASGRSGCGCENVSSGLHFQSDADLSGIVFSEVNAGLLKSFLFFEDGREISLHHSLVLFDALQSCRTDPCAAKA